MSQHDDVQPVLRVGGVRALSHLRQGVQGEPAAPRPPAATHLPSWITESPQAEAEADPHSHGDSEPPATASRDENGSVGPSSPRGATPPAGRSLFLTPRPMPPEYARQQSRTYVAGPNDHAPRSQQRGAGAPPRPTWSTMDRAGDDSSRSPSAPPHAYATARPWHIPAINHEVLDSQNLDDNAAGSHSIPKATPEVHDLVYRTPGASTPKPGLQDLVYRPQESITRNLGHAPNRYLVQAATKNKAPVQSQQREDEPSHDRDFTAEQQKQFIEAMKNKALELYHHHENRVGERTPAAATAKRDGKIVAYCNQYPSECVAAGYEAIGMPKTAQMIRDKTTKKDQAVHHLSKILHDRGWKSIFYNNDRTSPGAKGEHASDTGLVEKKGLYWGPDRMGADGKPKTDWMKVDGYKTDFSPGRPGYSDEATEDLKKIEFAVVNGCRGRHGAVMSNGGTYDVHRSEPDVNHLYGKTDFNRTSGLLQSGLLLIPPGGHIPSHTPTK